MADETKAEFYFIDNSEGKSVKPKKELIVIIKHFVKKARIANRI